MGLIVVKVGGSLLLEARLAPAFREWLAQRVDRCLVVFGGGGLADALRLVDQAHSLAAETSHWLAVDLMRVTARIGQALVPELPILESWNEVNAWRENPDGSRHAILDVSTFLRTEEPKLPGTPLPLGWHVTSDSIAARVATVLGKVPLWLLKSAPALEPPTRRHEARMGRVDLYFPEAADELPRVMYENLRERARAAVELARC